jgi:hypothetical protein
LKIVIKKLNPQAKMVRVGTFQMKKGKVVCSIPGLLHKMRGQMPKNWVEDKPEEQVTPKDGELFLRNLPYHFKSPYFMAEEA